jgi:hypothetical protein
MMKMARSLAALAPMVLAGSALAQPGAADGEPPPVDAGTVVIVTPQQPVVAQTAAPGQMVATAAVAGPPQNEPWNNVSHINGQIVKVGERGDYLLGWKTTSIATNPLGWIVGFYGLSVSHAVHDNVAIRVDGNVFSFENTGGYEVGVSAPLYLRRVFQGPFLEPGVIARNFDSCEDCGSRPASVGPEVLFGWHWTFDSGFNVSTAVGAMRNLNHSGGGSNVEPAGYFRVGYAM